MSQSPFVSLRAQLNALVAAAAKSGAAELRAAMSSEIAKLVSASATAPIPEVGSRAPDFSFSAVDGSTMQLVDLCAQGPVVLVFYRGGWCPFCDLQLRAYQLMLPKLAAVGAALIAISPQTPDYALSDAEKKQLTFPVVSDTGNQIARLYGIVVKLSDVLQQFQVTYDNPLPRFNGDSSWEIPMPAVFIIDPKCTIRFAAASANYTERVEPETIMGILQSL